MELAPDTTLKGMRKWTVKTGYELGSHVYPHNLMLVSKQVEPNNGDVRDWRVIRWNADKKKVEVLTQGDPLQSTAKYHLAMALAERGTSPNTKPAKRLTGVPFYPRSGPGAY